jgi:hypothetical protein
MFVELCKLTPLLENSFLGRKFGDVGNALRDIKPSLIDFEILEEEKTVNVQACHSGYAYISQLQRVVARPC